MVQVPRLFDKSLTVDATPWEFPAVWLVRTWRTCALVCAKQMRLGPQPRLGKLDFGRFARSSHQPPLNNWIRAFTLESLIGPRVRILPTDDVPTPDDIHTGPLAR